MAPPKPSKKLLKKLKQSNVCVEDPFGVTYRVPPVKELRDPIERFLPPAGQYYDQSVFDNSAGATDHYRKCVLCWHVKAASEECKCKQCAMCGTKHDHGTGCQRVYASIKWWQSHGHRLSKKAQLRPNPGERAYLVVAGVLKDWKKLEDPVVVNMDHPIVKAFYKGKEPPHLSAVLPEKLPWTPVAANAKPSSIRWIDEPDEDEADHTIEHKISVNTTPKQMSEQQRDPKSFQDQSAGPGMLDSTRDMEGGARISPVSPEEDKTLPSGRLGKPWQPPSYHEGTQRAAITLLSIRLALNTARGSAAIQQAAVSTGNEVRPDLDPRLRARAPSRYSTFACQSAPVSNPPHEHIESFEKGHKNEDKCEHCREELLKAQEEIKAKDRRIRELEASLHEAEGWTDAVTYQGAKKRPRA